MNWIELATANMSKHVQTCPNMSKATTVLFLVPNHQGDTETPRAPTQTPKVTGEPLLASAVRRCGAQGRRDRLTHGQKVSGAMTMGDYPSKVYRYWSSTPRN